MGSDKASLPVDGATLLAYVVDRLRGSVDEVIVAGGADPAIAGVSWVGDREPGAGPLSGMAGALGAARGDAAWVVACDLPEVVPQLGDLLFGALTESDEAVVPRVEGRAQPACAVYRTRLVPRIDELLGRGERSLMGLINGIRVRFVDAAELQGVDPGLRSFRNLNTPEDFARWLSER